MQPTQGQQPAPYGLPMNNAPLPVILNSQPQSSVKEKYKVKSVKILSILQILLGSAAIVLQIWDIINHSAISVVGAGIWTGVLFIIAGGLGLLSSNTKTTCAIVSFLVMSIIASVFTIGLLTCSAISVALGNDSKQSLYYQYKYRHEYEPYGRTQPSYYREAQIQKIDMIVGIAAFLVLISLAEAVVAILSAGYACHGLCCSKSQQGNVLIQGQVQCIPGPNGQTQMVIVPMPNQSNVAIAPPYQLTTPAGGFQTQPVTAPRGGMPQAQAAPPVQPPTYTGETTPPPEYEENEKNLLADTNP